MNKQEAMRLIKNADTKPYVEGCELMGVMDTRRYCVSVRFPDWQKVYYSLEEWKEWVAKRESNQYA